MNSRALPAANQRLSGKRIIVIGDGFIGGFLRVDLARAGGDVVGTSRRCADNLAGAMIHLDLLRQEEATIPPGFDAAVVAAGISGFRACDERPEAETLNARKIPDFVKRLLENGVFTAYLSSSAVFADSLPSPAEDSPRHPGTAYGRQKAQCEDAVLEYADAHGLSKRLSIVRLSKVVANDASPLHDWRSAWKSGKRAMAFSDLRFSPITRLYLSDSLRSVIAEETSGALHLSGEKGISHLDFCRALSEKEGAARDLITASTTGASGIKAPFKPVDGALGMRRTTARTGIHPQTLAAVMSELSLAMIKRE